jgi:hypothetical protein
MALQLNADDFVLGIDFGSTHSVLAISRERTLVVPFVVHAYVLSSLFFLICFPLSFLFCLCSRALSLCFPSRCNPTSTLLFSHLWSLNSLSLPPSAHSYACLHKHTHLHTYTCTDTWMRVHTALVHIHILHLPLSLSLVCACIHPCTQSISLALSLSLMRSHPHSLSLVLTHVHTHTHQSHTHSLSHTLSHIQIHDSTASFKICSPGGQISHANVIQFRGGERLIGADAVSGQVSNPTNTVLYPQAELGLSGDTADPNPLWSPNARELDGTGRLQVIVQYAQTKHQFSYVQLCMCDV